jgi:hypothetical protein
VIDGRNLEGLHDGGIQKRGSRERDAPGFSLSSLSIAMTVAVDDKRGLDGGEGQGKGVDSTRALTSREEWVGIGMVLGRARLCSPSLCSGSRTGSAKKGFPVASGCGAARSATKGEWRGRGSSKIVSS